VWNGREVPEVLLSGHHKNIETWRHQKALENTWRKRPDMLENYPLTKEDKRFLRSIGWEEKKA
jgi:tRNA (guanine37-N1)-methyltransferase